MHQQRNAERVHRDVTALTLSVSEIAEVPARILARAESALETLDGAIDSLGGGIDRLGGVIRRLDEAALKHIGAVR